MITYLEKGGKICYLCISQDMNIMQKIKNITERIFQIYCLKDPNTLEIRYIGVTTTSLSNRLSQHIYDSKKEGGYKRNWIKSLNGIRPIIEKLEDCDYLNWEEKEKHWISLYTNLTNTREGGVGVVIDRTTTSIQRSTQAKCISIVAIRADRKIRTFNSIMEASRILSIPRSSIEYSLTDLNFSAHGYNFILLSEYKEEYKLNVIIRPKKYKIKILYKEHYYTSLEFQKLMNVSEASVNLWCNGKVLWENSRSYDGNTIQIFKI